VSGLAHVDAERRGDLCVLHIRGEVDISNARDLAIEIEAAILNGTPRIAIDLAETTYLDSAGVQLLFLLADRLKVRRHELRLIVPEGSPIRAVLELTNLPKIVPMEPQLDEVP